MHHLEPYLRFLRHRLGGPGLLSFHCEVTPYRLYADLPAYRFGSVRRNRNAVSTRRGCLRCIAMPSQ